MRYEDASGTFQASGPIANDDADTLAAGSRGPATGNLITGEGTQYGAAGADSAAGAHVAAIAGQGGEDSSFSGGKLSVAGQFGSLTVDAEGNYSYLANKGAPENVRDRFTYTLADNQGNTDTGALIVEIGKTPAVIKADAQQIVPGPDGVVTLPPGVELSDIMVVGRNLVVNMPDGTQLIIVDGAVFVPQLSLGGVEVPATNVAALLVGQEVQPAAGEVTPSSGGNFALPPPPLDPGVPLGDLLPPTEYTYIPPEPQQVFDILDEEPEIFVQPDGQPAQVNAVDQVEEAGLPTRNGGEPAGSAESADGNGADNDVASETTGGNIVYDSPDGVASITLNGVAITSVGQVIAGAFGTLTITSIAPGVIGYSYTLNDNTSGNDTHDDFAVVLTDTDGDQAAATLRIDIIDDVPTARPDTDVIASGQFGPATGNVITDASAGDAGDGDAGADTVGADNATVTAVSSVNVPANSDNSSPFVVNGQYGVLTLNADGSYSYVRNPGTPGGVQDVFNYTLTDGDGDTSSTTLTISIGDATPQTGPNPIARTDDDAVPGENGNPGGVGDDIDAENLAGTLAGSGGDGPLTFDLLLTGAPAGFSYVDGPNGSVLVQQVQNGSPVTVLTITINSATGAYTITQNAAILHPTLDGQAGDDTENNVSFTINYNVTDQDGDSAAGTLQIDVDDDTPTAKVEVDVGGTVDEDGLSGGNVGGVNDVPGAATVVQGNVSDLFNPGADQPLTYSLSTDTSGLPQDLTSNGAAVTYSVVGNTLTASANGSPVFTLVLNPTTGEYTFTLLDQLDHPSLDGLPGDDTENPDDSDLSIALGSIIQATDADGDTVTADANGLNIIVDDDSPEPFEDCPEDVITVNEVGSTFTGDLNLPPVGADQPGIVSFVVEDGDPVLDNEGNPVTSEGVALFYFVNDDGVLEARAGDATGEVIFTITLNDDGTFTYEQVGIFGEGDEFTFDDLTSTSAGNVEFRGVGADNPATTVDLLLSAGPGDGITVNTDSDSIGSANQSMDNGETVRIDLVTDLTSGAATPSGFGYTGHVSSSSFIGLIPQVQGSQDETTAFTVWALDSNVAQGAEPDRDPAGGFSDATITAVTEVTVKDFLTGESTTVDVTGFTVGVFTAVAYGISARVNADGSVTFSGIQQGDSYGFSTGSGDFNAVVVRSEPAGTGGSTQDSYDLGVFSIGVANEFDPFGLSIPIALTDSDGDAVVCDIDINVGVPLDAPEITVTVNEAGLPLIGSDAASNSEIASGDLQGQVSGGTGPYTFTLVSNGNGAFGTLVLNADGTFTYTLDTPFDSQPDANDGTNPELGAETFTFEATDSLGAVQTGTITINIIDDVPTAVADTDSIAAGQYGPVDGNVITDASAGDAGDGDNGADTKGADGATVVGVAAGDTNADLDNSATVGVVIQGTYGKLTLNSDGSYSYVRDPGTDGGVQDVFTYTIEDGDGDLSNATLTITIADSPPTIDAPDQGEAGTVVDEKGLPTRGESPGSGEIADGNGTNNSDTSETTAGVINFTAPDGPAIIRIDGVVVTGVIGQTFNGSHGVLTITSYDAATGQIGYSYTLSDNTSGDATFDDFAIQVEDQDGDVANDTLVVNIIDDVPTANNDVDSVVGGFDPATGNVLTGSEVAVGEDANGTDGVADVPGADGGRITNIDHDASPAEAVPNGGSTDIQGDYGVLTIFSNGDYSYQRDPGTPGGVSDVFTYTLTDGDGDTTTATLTIGIDDNFPNPPENEVVLLDDDTEAGGIAGGPGDRSPDTDNTSGTLVANGGDGDLDYFFSVTQTLPTGFTSNVVTLAGVSTMTISQGGTPVIEITLNNESGAYNVTQLAAIDHAADGNTEGEIPLSNILSAINVSVFAQDQDGDQSSPGTISISVDDDTPTINVTQTGEAGVVLTTQDAETDGVPTAEDTDVTAINFGGVFGLTSAGGADGGTAAPLSFDLNVVAQNSGLTSHGLTINLFEVGGVIFGTTAGVAPVDATTPGVVFSLAVSGSGVVTLTQYQQVDHAVEGVTTAPFDDQFATLVNGKITLTASSSITDGDGDTFSDQEVVDLGGNIRFADDGPVAAIAETGQSVSVDESVGIQLDSNDTTNAGVIALFAGVANVGTDTHLPQYAQNASAVVNSTGSVYGADGAGTTVFSLNVSSAGVDSGLNTTAGQDILLFKEGSLIVGRVSGGADDGKAAFAIAIDPVTGVVSMVEYLSIQHPNAANPDDSVSIADGAVLAVVTVTDFDGDTSTQQVGIGSAIQFQDSAPVMTAAQNMNIQNSGDVAHTAAFAFNLGADGANTSNDVITNVTGSATVGGVAVQNWTLTPGAENATTATYTFDFDYPVGGGATAHATGTLVFDKVAGTYTVDLANPIQGVTTILQTAQGTLFQGYEFGTSTPDGSQPAISVTQIQDLAGTANDIYVQFTSVSEPSSGTGDNNLEVTNWVPGANNPAPINGGGDVAWNAGQLFNQVDGWVSTSNSANGVDGDTIQGGEVLDFSLVKGPNPTGTLADPSTYAQASAMFLKFDGIGASEDMIVILKLFDPNTNQYTTRAIMVENSDIQKGPGAGPGQYSGITLDQNDGLVIIESNDYNNPGENWVIVGAQIAGSDEGITGTAINLNSAIGAGDSDVDNNGSLDTDALGFQSDTDDGPFKISSIGFLTTSTTPQDAHFDFNVTVTDGDGDSITQAIAVDVTAAADSVSAATIPAGNTTVSQAPLDSKNSAAVSESLEKTAANSNTVTMAAAVAASGMADSVAAQPVSDAAVMSSADVTEASHNVGNVRTLATHDGDGGSALVAAQPEEAPAIAQAGSSGSARSNASSHDGQLDAASNHASDEGASHQAASDHGQAVAAEAQVAVAPTVMMASAEALQAAGLNGDAKQGGSVEKIVAEALGQGDAPTVDGLLAHLPGGIQALAHVASQDAGSVPGWDMAAHGGFATGHDMLLKVDVISNHHDAIQPAVNG